MKKFEFENPIVKEIFSYVVVIIAALLLGWLINTFILSNNTIPTGSMIPTIPEESRIFGNRLTYKFSDPERGDIVVFKYPVDESQLFIKRVIGLPGETIQVKDGNVYINGDILDESDYLNVVTEGEFGPYEIPQDSYFMMGDNRNESSDSRFWNIRAQEDGLTVDSNHDYTTVKKDKLVSKAFIMYYPKLKLLH